MEERGDKVEHAELAVYPAAHGLEIAQVFGMSLGDWTAVSRRRLSVPCRGDQEYCGDTCGVEKRSARRPENGDACPISGGSCWGEGPAAGPRVPAAGSGSEPPLGLASAVTKTGIFGWCHPVVHAGAGPELGRPDLTPKSMLMG